MKSFITMVISLLTFVANAQFAIIHDNDGFALVRNNASNASSIADTLKNGHLVFILEKNGDWLITDYSNNNEQRNGFINKENIKEIADYPFVPLTKNDATKALLYKDSIQIVVSQKSFDKTKHSFTYDSDSKSFLIKIDNKEFWGTDGGMPQTAYQSIKGSIGKLKFSIPPKGLENLYEVTLENTSANYDDASKTLFIKSINSDGAGSYYVIWKIVNGKYAERQIFYGF